MKTPRSVREWDDTVPTTPDDLSGQLWVVHTRARNEKALARDLLRRNIPVYLPTVKVVRRYLRQRVERRLPLFPSYLFMSGTADDRYIALMTHRAASVIPVKDQDQLRRELHHIHLATCSDTPVDLYPGIRQGKRCRVIAGPVRGLEGVVLRRRDLCRVYVGVEALGQSAELEVDASQIEIIE